jgi:hypothetical protein
MRPDSDLGVVLHSTGGRKALFALFLVAILLDFDMLLMPILARWGLIHPARWAHWPHILASTVEAGAMIGATIFWLLMLCVCMFDPRRPVGLKLTWGLVFLFTTWVGAQLFYLFPFLRSIKRQELPG